MTRNRQRFLSVSSDQDTSKPRGSKRKAAHKEIIDNDVPPHSFMPSTSHDDDHMTETTYPNMVDSPDDMSPLTSDDEDDGPLTRAEQKDKGKNPHRSTRAPHPSYRETRIHSSISHDHDPPKIKQLKSIESHYDLRRVNHNDAP